MTTVAISADNVGGYKLTTQVNPRHTRVFELEDDNPILTEYRALSDRWHILQGKIAELYHHV